MCHSIARHWRKTLLPDRWWKLLWSAGIAKDEGLKELFAADDDALDSEYTPSIAPEPPGDVPPEDEPSDPQEQVPQAEQDTWTAQLHRLHRAAGHPSTRNLVRLCQDAQLPSWKIRAAKRFSCPICQEFRPGGESSGKVPPA